MDRRMKFSCAFLAFFYLVLSFVINASPTILGFLHFAFVAWAIGYFDMVEITRTKDTFDCKYEICLERK